MASGMYFTWDGEAMHPKLPRVADRTFVIGENYFLEEVAERSIASHNHEFAWLKEAWMQLPEQIAERFPSPEHLRKRALIDAGYYNQLEVDAGTNAAALRVAQAFRSIDEFAVAVVRGPIVVLRTAKSQSRRAMKGKEFNESKRALMEVVAAMVGVSPDELVRHAGKAA